MKRDYVQIKTFTRVAFGAYACIIGLVFGAMAVWPRQQPDSPDDSPFPRYNETSCQLYMTRTRCRHLTGIIGYHLGHYESTKGHFVTYRIGDRLVREYWMSREFTVLDDNQ